MPVDSSIGTAAAARRTFRKLSTEEEVEIKRARGEISCAECRRLKLKCDKKLPCGSCVRRGCPTICPNGSLSTGQGTRFVLADTEHLHQKIAQMGQRIRHLEDALAIFQAGVSSEVHPLLAEDLLAIKHGPEVVKPTQPPESATRNAAPVPLDTFGTLTIGEAGEAKYYGNSAGSETLFIAGAELNPQPEEYSKVSDEITQVSSKMPLGIPGFTDPGVIEDILETLLSLLPPYPRASTLCETYMEQAAWMFRPILRDELFDDILAPIYKIYRERKEGARMDLSYLSHTLALLYLVFAQGALMDLTLPPFSADAENYYVLGRMALSTRPLYELPTTQTIQSVCLVAYYQFNSGRRDAFDGAWTMMSFASKLAQTIGLHRDPARFKMSPKLVQRRRHLFWEIFSSDLFHSLALGRPPSIRLSYVDCEFPEDESTTMNSKGEIEMGFWRWKHSFTKDVFAQIIEVTLTAEPPTYETILELDRKLREKSLPPSLNLYLSNGNDEATSPSTFMRGRILSQFRTATMISIHRNFFAKAMLDHPVNPLRSPYAPSFLAAYRCASATIKTTVYNFQQYPGLFSRWATVWSHLFNAAIIVGCIVTRAPSSTMAPAALIELDLAVDLFYKGAADFRRAKDGLAVLSKMKAKAYEVFGQYRSGGALPNFSNNPSTLLPEIGGEDELAMFGGQTRILVSKIVSQGHRKKPQSSSANSPASTTSTPSTTDDSQSSEPIPEVHPSLIEYLSLLPSTSSGQDLQHSGHYTGPLGSPKNIFNYPNSSLDAQTPQTPTTFNMSPSFAMAQNPRGQTLPGVMGGFEGSQVYGASSASPPQFDMNSLGDFGMMFSGDSGMDDQWMAFMRDTGVFPDMNMQTGS